MGYLDNSTITVDAILTNKGREILAAGGRLNITKFALSDDEIDYDLWNPTHTLGTNYYGAVIENMPVLEALPDETQMMRYKLITLPKDSRGIPVISLSRNAITLTNTNQIETITPATLNLTDGNMTLGYTAILSDDTVATLEVAPDGNLASIGSTSAQRGPGPGPGTATDMGGMNNFANITSFLDDEATGITTAGRTITRTGKKFTIQARVQPNGETKRALLTIIGNETGGFKTIVITVSTPTITNVATGLPGA